MDKFMKKITAGLVVLGLLCLGYVSGFVKGFPPAAHAEVEDWAGHVESIVSASQQTTGTALVCTAVTGYRFNVKSADLSGATAGNYVFFSGPTPSGANQIGEVYLAANTPRTLTASMFRGGMKTVNGSGLYVVGPGILTYSLVVRQEANLP